MTFTELAGMTDAATSRRPPIALMLLAGAVGLALAGTVSLWAHYGSTVFFEMIQAGFAACFG
jgi:hypothetical protein